MLNRLRERIALFEGTHPEWDEYSQNDYTKSRFPKAFKDAKHFSKLVREAPTEYVDDFSNIHNTDAGEKDLSHALEQYLERFRTRDEMNAYHQKLMGAVKRGKSPPSLIGIHKDPSSGRVTKYLLAGNTRAIMHRKLGMPVKVKHIPLAGPQVIPHGED